MKKNNIDIDSLTMINSEEKAAKNSGNYKTQSKRKYKTVKKANDGWMLVQASDKYRNHVALETCQRITDTLKSELFDGFSIVLNSRNCTKSEKIQKRIMRRIIEKRQAQATHQKLGRTADLFVPKIERANVSRCMYEFV